MNVCYKSHVSLFAFRTIEASKSLFLNSLPTIFFTLKIILAFLTDGWVFFHISLEYFECIGRQKSNDNTRWITGVGEGCFNLEICELQVCIERYWDVKSIPKLKFQSVKINKLAWGENLEVNRKDEYTLAVVSCLKNNWSYWMCSLEILWFQANLNLFKFMSCSSWELNVQLFSIQ